MSGKLERFVHDLAVKAERLEVPRPAPDDPVARFAGDPCGFAEALVDPDTGRPFVLYEAERRFLCEALTPDATGALPYPELLYSAPKKSGKTTLAALMLLYVVRVLGGRFAEGYCVANDFDQAAGRVFRAAVKLVEASPLLRGSAAVTVDEITFADGATITALPSDYAGAAGANPTMVVFDELWAYTSERAHLLWDELVPVPTRRPSVRLTVTYAGFEGESDLLESLATAGRRGTEIAPALYRADGLLMYWSHVPVAPWQTPSWLAQMRRQLRPNAYLRMIENRFVSGESGFVPPEWWAACEMPDLRPLLVERTLPVWVGVDASVKRDRTAVVVVTWREEVKRVRLVWHQTFQPSPADPLDFEATIGETVRELARRFDVREVRFDPYQLVALAQRLRAVGVPMVEFPQTVGNLTEASATLYDLVKGRNLEVYADAELREAVGRAVALETARGWRIAKEKAGHKIDVVVALAQACLAAVKGASLPGENFFRFTMAEAAAYGNATALAALGGAGLALPSRAATTVETVLVPESSCDVALQRPIREPPGSDLHPVGVGAPAPPPNTLHNCAACGHPMIGAPPPRCPCCAAAP